MQSQFQQQPYVSNEDIISDLFPNFEQQLQRGSEAAEYFNKKFEQSGEVGQQIQQGSEAAEYFNKKFEELDKQLEQAPTGGDSLKDPTQQANQGQQQHPPAGQFNIQTPPFPQFPSEPAQFGPFQFGTTPYVVVSYTGTNDYSGGRSVHAETSGSFNMFLDNPQAEYNTKNHAKILGGTGYFRIQINDSGCIYEFPPKDKEEHGEFNVSGEGDISIDPNDAFVDFSLSAELKEDIDPPSDKSTIYAPLKEGPPECSLYDTTGYSPILDCKVGAIYYLKSKTGTQEGNDYKCTFTFMSSPQCIPAVTDTNARSNNVRTSPAFTQVQQTLGQVGNTLLCKAPDRNQELQRIPIIIIPGIAGTKIIRLTADGEKNEVWPSLGSMVPGTEPPLAGTATKSDGRTPVNPYQYEYEILRGQGLPWGPLANFYGGLINYLVKTHGYKENVDLFTFPYDWRFDNAAHFGTLDTLINTILDDLRKRRGVSTGAESGAEEDKVIIIAHSMGGLLSKGYILSSAERAEKVRALITIGTPYWGAAKAYSAIIDGYNFGNPAANKKDVKVLAQNAPAPYELLPRIDFVMDERTGRFLPKLGSYEDIRYKAVNSDGTESNLNNLGMNPTVLDIANQFYSSFGTPQSPTKLPVENYVIAGVRTCTLSGFVMRDFDQSQSNRVKNIPFAIDDLLLLRDFDPSKSPNLSRRVALTPIFGDGDGTVPLWSSQLDTATRTWLVKHSFESSAAHSSLPANTRVHHIVGQYINAMNSGTPPPPVPPAYDPKNYSPMKPIVVDPAQKVKLPSQCAK